MSTGPLTIRRAAAEDAPFLQAMIWEAMLASPTVMALRGFENVQRSEERYWRRWVEYGDPAFVAVDATGRKLGGILIIGSDEDEPMSGWRLGVGVEAQMRGQGVGRCLLEWVIAFAREQGSSYVDLLVDSANTRAMALYQRVGFVEVGKGHGAIKMQINLDARTKE